MAARGFAPAGRSEQGPCWTHIRGLSALSPGVGSAIINRVPRVHQPDTVRKSGLTEIDRVECLRLLASAQIGRVIYTEAAMPAAHPVNYFLDAEEIVFRTSGGGKLAAAARGIVVGFQVDQIDLARCSGWSVLGVGEAFEIRDPARLAELADRLPVPWAPHRTGHCISVPMQRLTGRWLFPPDEDRFKPRSADGTRRPT